MQRTFRHERYQTKKYEEGTSVHIAQVITDEMVYDSASTCKNGKANGVEGVLIALYKHLNVEAYANLAKILNDRYEGNANQPREWICSAIATIKKNVRQTHVPPDHTRCISTKM